MSLRHSRSLMNKFDLLYEDAIRRKELSKKINEFNSLEYSFKPKINEHSRALSQSHLEKLTLLERLQIPIGVAKSIM